MKSKDNKRKIEELRVEYSLIGIELEDLNPDPIQQFEEWFDAAAQSGIREPNGMTLSTVDRDGFPSGRVVLLKGYDSEGFLFYTNYESAKGVALAANPYASLTFWWAELERQIRIKGNVEKAREDESDRYYNSRPRGSRLGAWSSPQSQPIQGRELLERRLSEAQERFPEDQPLPRPPFWGGYRLKPFQIEFWQGRKSRLHDRIRYDLHQDGRWERTRLAP